ncbi:hypothetical protein [Actinomadura sp. KC345]|uniref:hypothetical protein n=1 Tax=Actinomadura sp. KC345 TaxID=2530371 RepID=UPI001405003D|nr:hypothetical protein [Actinomadura sp. KC345]
MAFREKRRQRATAQGQEDARASAGSQRLFSARRRRNDEWHAYGTGVRWLPA